MRRRRSIWILLCLLCATGAWLLWHGRGGSPSRPPAVVAPSAQPRHPSPVASGGGIINTNPAQISLEDWNTNRFAGRLSNTAQSIGQLAKDNHAILLENALIDTREPLDFVFPKHLQPQGDPGAYIVQANGPIGNAFRALLARAGATVVSYIPNNAYLVRAPASVANTLGASPLTQAVVPYEPYYKIQSALLFEAVGQMRLPDNTALTLGLFADDAKATTRQIEKLGGQIVGRDRSPFGPVVRVIPPRDWTVLATLSGVQIVEPAYQRATANDLSRATVGVAADSLTVTNYLGLTGSNIVVAVDDTGIDANHPDLGANSQYGRTIGVIGAPENLVDTNGHGTHVAGIIAGDGEESTTVTNAPGSLLPGGTGTNYQFRGMAPGATLYSLNFDDPDQELQEAAAQTNALISNNSWVYGGDSTYDLAAASYDAATRDALPGVTGSQPVLFVFAAGNEGNGQDNSYSGGGIPDSIESPATAKNVITVGALQEQRNITATVTNADGTTSTPWADETSTSDRVAGFSSRGNTGIGIEGKYGRYKPDVCAPGTFIISDRSEQWDTGTYFYQDPTNHQTQTFSGVTLTPGSFFLRPFPFVRSNVVQLTITTYPNANSPYSFAELPTLMALIGSSGFGFTSYNNPVVIPGDPNAPTLQQIFDTEGAAGAFAYAISNNTDSQVVFDLQTDVITTNGSGNYFLVLSNLDQSIGTPPEYYRFESGTSMAAAAVSGMLALMQEFYANAYGANPSPAMLKAMLINGAQATASYDFQVQNSINYEGWGLANLPDSLPMGITNQLDQPCSAYVQDQSPTNALATGDRQTYDVTTTANGLPLRVTLAWTDPPGDPAAAIKLVNNLVLVVTNLTNPTNPIVYYGNDFDGATGYTFSKPEQTNTPPVFDSINNVENVYLPPDTGTNFSVTVLGYRVNVNAVTAQTNNVVQDYALVISTGVTNSMTVTATPASFASNPTGSQRITYPSQTAVGYETTFAQLLNQFVGANSPLLGNNTATFTANAPEGFGPNDWQVTVGQTNQWHFYVVTNSPVGTNGSYPNAAFIVFNPNAPDPDTLSVPRMGVFASTPGNATREADIDLYVSTDPGLTNLDPNVISNCVLQGTQVGQTVGGSFTNASLGRGTTEFVVDTNSQKNEVYYIGVKSEDQMSAEYGFISIFSASPFSTMNNQGVQTVYGVPVPMGIPDGSPTVPGKSYVFGLAIYPETVGSVTVSNFFYHQNFGDLIGTLTLNGGHADVLNNHDSFANPDAPYLYPYSLLYDDSAGGGSPGSRPSDGPGSLNGYMGQQALGVWMLNEVDDSLTQTGQVDTFTVRIQPHQNLNDGGIFTVPPGGWVYDYVDVPPGATNLTIYGTNLTDNANPPLELFVKLGSEPTTNDYDYMALLDLLGPLGPGNSISIGPPLESGRYFVGVFNPSTTSTRDVYLLATIGLGPAPEAIFNSTDTPKPILDDAVTYDSIYVPANQYIYSLDVALAVQHPRISDLVFHLISPDGTRELLMENRGGTDTNGAGGIASIITNVPVTGNFDAATPGDYTNGQTVAGWNVTGSQVTVQTDPANANPVNTNLLALANGTLSTNLNTTPGATYTLTFAYRGPGILSWWRGEHTPDDALGFNNGTANGGLGYTNGEVDQAFYLNGTDAYVLIPDGTRRLNFDVRSNAYTVAFWVNLAEVSSRQDFLIDRAYNNVPCSYDIYYDPGTGNHFIANCWDGSVNVVVPSTTTPVPNQWYHLAAVFDSPAVKLYVDGTSEMGPALPGTPETIPANYGSTLNTDGARLIGRANILGYLPYYTDGELDEVQVFNRALSDSEIQAIHTLGTNGSFDPIEFTNSPSASLAEAQLSINNGGTVISTNFFGNNTVWQTKSITFTAASDQTLVQLQGLEPGMLLDALSVTNYMTNYNYLVFTENTNETTTPIKFAEFPLVPLATNTVSTNGFETAAVNDYTNGQTFSDGASIWGVVSNQVSVMDEPASADAGNNLLALADGSVTNILPTTAGKTYVLTFRYRGPGIVGWWRGEGNTSDSSGFGNNATNAPNITYTPGEVNQAFNYNGSALITVPPSASLAVSNLTFEGWIYPTTTTYEPIIDYGGPGQTAAAVFWINGYGLATSPGTMYADIRPDNPQVQSPSGVVPQNAWSHIAFTYNIATSTEHLYHNGGSVAVNPAATGNPYTYDLGEHVNLGYRNNNEIYSGTHFTGLMDEISIYNRALSASEINAIYQKGPLGKFDSGISNPQSLAEAQVSIDGGTPDTFFGDNNNWQTKTIVFTAKQNGTPLQITGIEPGMLLDSFSLAQSSEESYYLPEQPLDVFDGKDAYGTWTLEIQDDRVGATNPIPELLNWQLRFTFISLGTNGIGLPPGTIQTNVIPAHSWAYYRISVPASADQATNQLVFATGPLDLWFNANNNPNGGPSPPDWLLLGGATSGESMLTTFSVPTNIVPGGAYYIGLHNNNNYQVTNGFEVDFHYFQTTTLTNGVPITNVVTGTLQGDGVNYYSIAVPTNADYATNRLLASTTPVNVWFNQTKPPVCLSPPDSLLISDATNGVFVLSATSAPPLLPGLTYYLAVQNTNAPAATNVLQVNFHLLNLLTNGVPTTNSVPTNRFVYYEVQVPTNADYATNRLLFAALPLNVWFNQNVPPTGTNAGDYLLISHATSGVSVLSAGSTPPLVPGATYYLGVQNTNAVPVNFGLEVNFHLVPPPPPVIIGPAITVTNRGGTNGVLLTWFAPTNYQFQVQWTTNLLPAAWQAIPGVLLSYLPSFTPTNGIGEFQYFDDGTWTGGFGPAKFYRLIAYPPGATIPADLVIYNVLAAPGGLQFQWNGSTNYQYEIQWTTNVALPMSTWNVLSNLPSPPLTYGSGVFTFTDDGSLTGGPSITKFFRVLELP